MDRKARVGGLFLAGRFIGHVKDYSIDRQGIGENNMFSRRNSL